MGGDKTACLLRFSDIPSVLNTPGADALQCLDLWQKWRLAIGTNLKTSYSQLVQMSNKGVKFNLFFKLYSGKGLFIVKLSFRKTRSLKL